MIKVSNLHKKYGVFEALKGVSFEASDNQVLGLLGPNGAGKSTTMRIITGYMPATRGEVRVGDYEIHENPYQVKAMLGYLPESVPLHQEMNVINFLEYMGQLKGLTGKNLEQNLYHAMEVTNIVHFAHEPIRTLSKGYKQRVGIAQAIINQPRYLVLDEPTIGLDPNQVIEIRNLIRSLRENRTIILSSHILSEVQELCDSVVIIERGKIVAEGTPTNLRDMLSIHDEVIVTVRDDQGKATEIIQKIPGVKSVESYLEHSLLINLTGKEDIRPDIAKQLIKANIELEDIRKREVSLEDIFQKVTKEEARHGNA